jgi:glycosyltransferase involved in cell wall biosynthesis
MSKNIQVTHVAPSISREAGGLFESVRHLSLETSRHGMAIEVLSIVDRYSQQDALVWQPLRVFTFPHAGPRRFAWAPELTRHLLASAAEIVHLHGVWQYPTVAVLRWARQTRKPYLVSPHGMLEPWALKHSRYKKAIANWLFQNACLRGASCMRATAISEVESIRQIGLRNPVALIRNGVPFPATLPVRPPKPAGARKRALFFSRIHPKKGLLNLIKAWKRNADMLKAETLKSGKRKAESGPPPSDAWELVIVGPNEGGHLAEVMSEVRALGLEQEVSYAGEVWDEAGKLACYSQADLFVLPSFSENFGLVIAEAMSCGLPVITTKATPWEELETHRCGWWIETGEEPLFHALKMALATPPETLREMGLRGRDLIEAKYSWKTPGRQMAEVYEWLAGRRDRPAFIIG